MLLCDGFVCPCQHQVTSHHCAALCLSSFPAFYCSKGRSAVTQGWHMQKKLPGNNIVGWDVPVYSPPPHLMHPLLACLLLSSWRSGTGGMAGTAQFSSLWLILTTYTEQTWRTREGGEKRGGGGWVMVDLGGDIRRCCACLLLFLPSSLQEEQSFSLTNSSFTLHNYGGTLFVLTAVQRGEITAPKSFLKHLQYKVLPV